jgi:hypothetical protein
MTTVSYFIYPRQRGDLMTGVCGEFRPGTLLPVYPLSNTKLYTEQREWLIALKTAQLEIEGLLIAQDPGLPVVGYAGLVGVPFYSFSVSLGPRQRYRAQK